MAVFLPHTPQGFCTDPLGLMSHWAQVSVSLQTSSPSPSPCRVGWACATAAGKFSLTAFCSELGCLLPGTWLPSFFLFHLLLSLAKPRTWAISSIPTILPASIHILCPWDSLGKNTGVGHHFLLQGNVVGPGHIAKTKMRKSNKQMDAKQKKDFNHFQVWSPWW